MPHDFGLIARRLECRLAGASTHKTASRGRLPRAGLSVGWGHLGAGLRRCLVLFLN